MDTPPPLPTGIARDVLNYDKKRDFVGLASYLTATPRDVAPLAQSLRDLLTQGRFQSAFVIASHLAERGVVDLAVFLACALGGMFFNNAEHEKFGTDYLYRHAGQLSLPAMNSFRDAVVTPAYCRAMERTGNRPGSPLIERIAAIFRPIAPELAAAPATASTPKDAGLERAKANFNFFLFNHMTLMWHRMEDIIRPMCLALDTLGYRTQVNGAWSTDYIQLFTENFTNTNIIPILAEAKAKGAILGIKLTEDPEELKKTPGYEQRWKNTYRVLPYFDFFWELSAADHDRPVRWSNYVPAEKLAVLKIGAIPDARPLLSAQRKYPPTIDFLVYGKRTPYRDRWIEALRGVGYMADYSHYDLPGEQDATLPEYAAQSMLGSMAVMLDLTRGEDVTAPSATRLAFALQNNLPVITDGRIDLKGSMFDGYVAQASLTELVANRHYFRGPEFRTVAEAKAAAWRARYPMVEFMKNALRVVPGIGRPALSTATLAQGAPEPTLAPVP